MHYKYKITFVINMTTNSTNKVYTVSYIICTDILNNKQ